MRGTPHAFKSRRRRLNQALALFSLCCCSAWLPCPCPSGGTCADSGLGKQVAKQSGSSMPVHGFHWQQCTDRRLWETACWEVVWRRPSQSLALEEAVFVPLLCVTALVLGSKRPIL